MGAVNVFMVPTLASANCWSSLGCVRILGVGQSYPCGTAQAGRPEDVDVKVLGSTLHVAPKKPANYVVRVHDAEGGDCSGVAFTSKPSGFTQTCDNQMFTSSDTSAAAQFPLTESSKGYQVSIAYVVAGGAIGSSYMGVLKVTASSVTHSVASSISVANATVWQDALRKDVDLGCTPDGQAAKDTQGCSDCCSENKFGSGTKLCNWNKWTTQKICGCVADGECVYDTDYEVACCSQRGHYGGWPSCSPVPILPYSPSRCGCAAQLYQQDVSV